MPRLLQANLWVLWSLQAVQAVQAFQVLHLISYGLQQQRHRVQTHRLLDAAALDAAYRFWLSVNGPWELLQSLPKSSGSSSSRRKKRGRDARHGDKQDETLAAIAEAESQQYQLLREWTEALPALTSPANASGPLWCSLRAIVSMVLGADAWSLPPMGAFAALQHFQRCPKYTSKPLGDTVFRHATKALCQGLTLYGSFVWKLAPGQKPFRVAKSRYADAIVIEPLPSTSLGIVSVMVLPGKAQTAIAAAEQLKTSAATTAATPSPTGKRSARYRWGFVDFHTGRLWTTHAFQPWGHNLKLTPFSWKGSLLTRDTQANVFQALVKVMQRDMGLRWSTCPVRYKLLCGVDAPHVGNACVYCGACLVPGTCGKFKPQSISMTTPALGNAVLRNMDPDSELHRDRLHAATDVADLGPSRSRLVLWPLVKALLLQWAVGPFHSVAETWRAVLPAATSPYGVCLDSPEPPKILNFQELPQPRPYVHTASSTITSPWITSVADTQPIGRKFLADQPELAQHRQRHCGVQALMLRDHAKYAKSVRSAKSVQGTKDAKSVESVESAESTKSIESTEPAQDAGFLRYRYATIVSRTDLFQHAAAARLKVHAAPTAVVAAKPGSDAGEEEEDSLPASANSAYWGGANTFTVLHRDA
ncbi:unnamed protein product [Symbiodinium sp. KB8]|nr:unnamed protein product [Symbiodinium sp. KB8]